MQITLATLAQATPQQVFNQVATHMLTQNQHSMLKCGGCAYRSSAGFKCAVGCLIADNEYRDDMEGTNVSGLLAQCGAFPQALTHPLPHVGLLSKLQMIHDRQPVGEWRMLLRTLATCHGFDTTVLETEK